MQIIDVEISLNVYTIQMLLRIYIQVQKNLVCPFSCRVRCTQQRQSGSESFTFKKRGRRLAETRHPDICQMVPMFSRFSVILSMQESWHTVLIVNSIALREIEGNFKS